VHEGGISTPLIAHWPAGITANGELRRTPAHVIDIVPTVLELAGAPKPRQVLDGESLVKLFRDPDAKLQRAAICQHFSGYLGARR